MVTADGNCLMYALGKALVVHKVLDKKQLTAAFHAHLRWFVAEKMDEYFSEMVLHDQSEAYLTEVCVREDGYQLRENRVFMESTYFFVRLCFVLQMNFHLFGVLWKVVQNKETCHRTKQCVLVEHRYTFKAEEWKHWNGPTRLPGSIFDWKSQHASALDDLNRAGGFWKFVSHEMVEYDGFNLTLQNLAKSEGEEEPAQHLDARTARKEFRCKRNEITIGIDRVWVDGILEYHHCFLRRHEEKVLGFHKEARELKPPKAWFDMDHINRFRSFFPRLRREYEARKKSSRPKSGTSLYIPFMVLTLMYLCVHCVYSCVFTTFIHVCVHCVYSLHIS